MRFVFHFEVLPRRRRDLPPGAGPPVSNSARHDGLPAFGHHRRRRSTVSIRRRWWASGADEHQPSMAATNNCLAQRSNDLHAG